MVKRKYFVTIKQLNYLAKEGYRKEIREKAKAELKRRMEEGRKK
jgi:hypothetical protein